MADFTITLNTLLYKMNPPFDLQLTEYPTISEEYREQLNKKIVDHYRFHEIGYETPEMFRHFLKHRLNLIMPKYNVILESKLLVVDPLLSFRKTTTSEKVGTLDTTQTGTIDETVTNTGTTDIDETQTRETVIDSDTTVNSTSAQDSTQTTDNDEVVTISNDIYNVKSDTPDGVLVGDTAGADGYASELSREESTNVNSSDGNNVVTTDFDSTDSSTTATDTTDNTTNTIDNTTTIDTTATTDNDSTTVTDEDTTETLTANEEGFDRSPAEMIQKYVEVFEGVDSDIINDLSDLFMNVLEFSESW